MTTKRKINPMNRKFQKDRMKVERIMNKDLICKDCESKFPDEDIPGNVSKCEKFPECKPYEVLDGKECDEYEKQKKQE